MTSSTTTLAINEVSRIGSTVVATCDFDFPDQPSSASISCQDADSNPGYSSAVHDQHYVLRRTLIPSTNQITAPFGQNPTSPAEGTLASTSTISFSQANLPCSGYHPPQFQSIALMAPVSYDLQSNTVSGPGTRMGQVASMGPERSSTTHSQSQLQPASDLEDEEIEPDDPESIETKLLNELAPDRRVESNMLAFLVHGFVSWSNRFVFDPTLVLPMVVNHLRRSISCGHETRMKMLLIANAGVAIPRSTDYDLTDLMTLHKQLTDLIAEIRALGDTAMTREVALAAMEHSHQLISALFKVGSLARVLNVMDLYAPVFRRACPESSEVLVNLPRNLITMNVHLKYYAALDVIQSFVTQRPMFFRYDLDFLSPETQTAIESGNGSGLRWLYGIPDRLMIILARMNNLFEDFGNHVDLDTIQELENEIAACTPIVSANTGADPVMSIGRIMVQESWRMAAQVYLYMGLSGANSSDTRVTKVQREFMRFLRAIKPRSNPDSHMVLPMAILGVATTSPDDQSILLTRLWGVSECNKPDTVGNNIVDMLKDIWAQASGRPALWADLRTACLHVTRM